jgi:hypothetical protein
MNDYEEGLVLIDPRFTREALRQVALKVQDAIRQQKEGPLPAWIKAPPTRIANKESFYGRRK